MRKIVMKCWGLAHEPMWTHGQYLAKYDHEGVLGRGSAEFTNDVDKAMTFNNFDEAIAFRNRQSVLRPYRPDGYPNKPMSAWHWEFLYKGDRDEFRSWSD